MTKTALTLLLAYASSTAFGAEYIQVVTENLKPLNYLENNEIKGSSTKIVRQLLSEAGLASKFDVYPWARSYAMALNHKNTLIYTINRTPERESKFKWIGLTAPKKYNSSLYRLKANQHIKADNLDEAKPYTVGVNLGSVNHELLKSEGFKHISPVSQRSQSVKMLMRQRVDLIVGSYPILFEAFKKVGEPIEDIEVLLPFRVSQPYIAMSQQTSDELVEQLKSAYEGLVLRGDIPDFNDPDYKAP